MDLDVEDVVPQAYPPVVDGEDLQGRADRAAGRRPM
jgi:hypothetical protein